MGTYLLAKIACSRPLPRRLMLIDGRSVLNQGDPVACQVVIMRLYEVVFLCDLLGTLTGLG